MTNTFPVLFFVGDSARLKSNSDALLFERAGIGVKGVHDAVVDLRIEKRGQTIVDEVNVCRSDVAEHLRQSKAPAFQVRT